MVKKFRKLFLEKKIGGGETVNTKFPQPKVNSTTASGALDGVEAQQAKNSQELYEMNKQMGAGRRRQRGGAEEDVTVPQFNQTGADGNNTIAGTIDSTLTGTEQGRYDGDVNKPAPDSGMPKGGARKRFKRKTRRKKKRGRRKTKRRKKTRRARKTRKSRRKNKRGGGLGSSTLKKAAVGTAAILSSLPEAGAGISTGVTTSGLEAASKVDISSCRDYRGLFRDFARGSHPDHQIGNADDMAILSEAKNCRHDECGGMAVSRSCREGRETRRNELRVRQKTRKKDKKKNKTNTGKSKGKGKGRTPKHKDRTTKNRKAKLQDKNSIFKAAALANIVITGALLTKYYAAYKAYKEYDADFSYYSEYGGLLPVTNAHILNYALGRYSQLPREVLEGFRLGQSELDQQYAYKRERAAEARRSRGRDF